MSQSIQVLLALIVGLIIGVVASMTDFSALHTFITLGEPIGVLWVNAIRMTVIPLVVALLVTGIASASPIHAGRIGGKALMWFLVFVAGGALLTAVVAPPLLSLGEFDLDSFATNGMPSTTDQIELPQFRDWVVELIPSNPIAAAANDAMLPLIVFSVILALAITKIEPAHRERLVGFFDAISKAMLVIVGWILRVAPIGVFFLVMPLASNARVGRAPTQTPDERRWNRIANRGCPFQICIADCPRHRNAFCRLSVRY